MARVANVDIPNHKRGEIALTYIYGIGRSSANKILEKVGVGRDKRVEEWSEEDLTRIRTVLREEYVTEGERKAEVRRDKERLQHIGCYRGVRHRLGLPVRGQRTKTNARTRKGKRKTIANKKKAPAKK